MSRASHLPSVDRPRDSAPWSRLALADAPVGARLTVVAVDESVRDELAREGLLPGSRIEVISRVPLGGPVIVGVGRVRIALGSSLASRVDATPATNLGGAPRDATDRRDR